MARAEQSTSATVGFEEKLWFIADKLSVTWMPRSTSTLSCGWSFSSKSATASRLFLPSFRRRHRRVPTLRTVTSTAPRALFWVPQTARWDFIHTSAVPPNSREGADDASLENESAVREMKNEDIKIIAKELMKSLKGNLKINRAEREQVKAQIRVDVKRLLRKYGYPPDMQEKATKLVLEQAEELYGDWVGVEV